MGHAAGNLDTVRRVFEAAAEYIRGERGPFEAALRELCSRDIVLVPSSALASGDPGPFRGPERLLRQQREVAERWSDFRVTADEYVEVPPNTVVVLGKVAARGHDGGGYAMEIGVVNRLDKGRIVSMQTYQSKRRALEEAGAADLAARPRPD